MANSPVASILREHMGYVCSLSMTIHPLAGALLILAGAGSIGAPACASELIPPGLYEVTTQTSMPHLEENLRYATTREVQCLAHQEFSRAFPVLAHPALGGCRLDGEKRSAEHLSYALVCEGAHGTTGHALWRLSGRQFAGTLHVKLGGKNMTFSQRVVANLLGECE
jgi:hypothetical protein